MYDTQDVSHKRVSCKSHQRKRIACRFLFTCNSRECVCDRGRDDSQNWIVRGFFPRWQIYTEIFLERFPFFLFFLFFFLRHPVQPWLRSAQQRETINDFFRQWRNLCVSCNLLHYLYPCLFVFLSFCTVPRDRELPLSCRTFYSTWSKTPSSCSALHFT